MKVIKPGHVYELSNVEGGAQTLKFIHKELSPGSMGGNYRAIEDGTTNEEVLEMMIDRLNAINYKVPSRETQYAIGSIEVALMWLNKRTADREKRGVLGTPLP